MTRFDGDGFDDDPLRAADPEPPRMHADIPITRQLSAGSPATQADAQTFFALLGELMLEDRPAGALPAAPQMPARAAAPARGHSHQVNFRLGAQEHARLVEVAREYGLRPGAFARVLTVRGVNAGPCDARRGR